MASFKPSIPPTSDSSTSGEVHVTMFPMFAGKTPALLRRIKLEGNSGRNVAMIKSGKDTRYAIDSVVTHDGVKFPCWPLSDLSSFRVQSLLGLCQFLSSYLFNNYLGYCFTKLKQ